MKIRLESLPNELLLYLFDYISIVDIFHSFASLNQRFNQLIFVYVKTNFHLDLRSIFMYDLITICRLYLPDIVNEIISLCFSNDNKTSLEIQLIQAAGLFDYQLINIQSLKFYHIFSRDRMIEIIDKLNNFPNLTHFKLIDCCFPLYDNFDSDIIDKIWSLSKLKHLYISSIFRARNVSIRPSIRSLTIKYISIQNIFLIEHSLNNLFQFTPYLQCLDVSMESSKTHSDIQYVPYLIKFKLTDDIRPNNAPLIEGIRLRNILQAMPNLCYLSVEISSMWLDGYRWEYLIKNYLPKLKIFQCKMETIVHTSPDINDRINHLLQSFQTHFWIKTHRLFIRCHWNAKSLYGGRLLYYTLPYTFRQSIILTDYLWSKSTSPYDSDHWETNSVRRLKYHSISSSKGHFSMHFQAISTQRSINWCERIHHLFRSAIELRTSSLIMNELMKTGFLPSLSKTCPIPRFTTIYELTIDCPLDEYFSYFIPKLDRLSSLNILLSTHHIDRSQSQLQILLDHAPNLCSLNILGDFESNSKFLVANIRSRSIYRLNLRETSQSYTSIAYTMEQCIALTRSPLGKQCEILTIGVTERNCIIYLIKKMINLRILNVHSQDDKYQRTLRPTKNDDFIQWLQLHLPSTIKIILYEFPVNTIHIWIR